MLGFPPNGRSMEVGVVPGTPRLWGLRDTRRATGIEHGCGAALRGACTPHEGEPAVPVTAPAVAGARSAAAGVRRCRPSPDATRLRA